MIYRFLLLVFLFSLVVSCDSEKDTKLHEHHTEDELAQEPALIHTVYFWTKDGTTAEEVAAFEEGLIKLATCPTILEYYWGPPAPTEARGVIDNSYAYAINVHFATIEDEAAYQKEPIHLKFIEDHQDIWDKVIVYDNLIK